METFGTGNSTNVPTDWMKIGRICGYVLGTASAAKFQYYIGAKVVLLHMFLLHLSPAESAGITAGPWPFMIIPLWTCPVSQVQIPKCLEK